MAIETRLSALINSWVFAEKPPKVAVIVIGLLVIAFAVTRPVPVTVAIFGKEEVHVATLETSCDVPSSKLEVAVNCWLTPSANVAGFGKTESPVGFPELTVN